MKDEEEVQKLIALKRYETPGEAYYEQFAENFKDRQRSEMLRHSSRALLAERVSVWFNEMNGAKWLAPAGAVAAAVAVGVFVLGPEENENATPMALLAEQEVEAASIGGNEDFQIDLPKPDQRVPELKSEVTGGANTILPASVRGNLLEL